MTTTNFEVIASSTGHSFGVYEAETAEGAIRAMLDDAGHDGPADADVVATALVGRAAIDAAERLGLMLCKHADPTEGAREGLSVDEANEVAAQDAGLIYATFAAEAATESASDFVVFGGKAYRARDLAFYADREVAEKVCGTVDGAVAWWAAYVEEAGEVAAREVAALAGEARVSDAFLDGLEDGLAWDLDGFDDAADVARAPSGSWTDATFGAMGTDRYALRWGVEVGSDGWSKAADDYELGCLVGALADQGERSGLAAGSGEDA